MVEIVALGSGVEEFWLNLALLLVSSTDGGLSLRWHIQSCFLPFLRTLVQAKPFHSDIVELNRQFSWYWPSWSRSSMVRYLDGVLQNCSWVLVCSRPQNRTCCCIITGWSWEKPISSCSISWVWTKSFWGLQFWEGVRFHPVDSGQMRTRSVLAANGVEAGILMASTVCGTSCMNGARPAVSTGYCGHNYCDWVSIVRHEVDQQN